MRAQKQKREVGKARAAGETPAPQARRPRLLSVNEAIEPADRLIHERMRLAIISALAVNDSLSFAELKTLLKTSDGNLSVHARKLEDAGYVSCTKTFDERTPRTEYGITDKGRRALEKYLDQMEALIKAARRKS
jgi:DNA-binding HxlR family transcriptional regulator